jgi:UDP-N-acetylmuramate: L-alanyl-gamma-D-glutamyl-meso-diaminopimelate ligase
MKKMPMLDKEEVAKAFNHPQIEVYTEPAELSKTLRGLNFANTNLLLMSSGKFGGIDIQNFL